MIVKTIGLWEVECRFQEELHFHLGRGDIGAGEGGLRRQCDDVGSCVWKRVSGVDLGAGSAQPTIEAVAKIPIKCLGILGQVVEVQGQPTAELVLILHSRHGTRWGFPNEGGIRGAAIVVDVHTGLPCVSVVKKIPPGAAVLATSGLPLSNVQSNWASPFRLPLTSKSKYVSSSSQLNPETTISGSRGCQT